MWRGLIIALALPAFAEAFLSPAAISPVGRTLGRPSGASSLQMAKPVLYDLPVSNNGARCRIIIYKKGIEDKVDIKSPKDLGGLVSPEYLKLNPQGKMPLLVCDDITLPESDTICRHLLALFPEGPSFVPASLAARARADLLARLHDMYITTIQGVLYKPNPPFGMYASRTDAIAELRKQLKILSDAADPAGPYLAGSELSIADAAIFPTMLFVWNMLPRFLPSGEVFSPETEFPTLAKWFSTIQDTEPVFARVAGEVQGGLDFWAKNGRWDAIHLAGKRDIAPATIFDKILAKEIPSDVVYEDSKVLVFKDINPKAPTHLLLIPKHREGLTQLREAAPDHAGVLGHLLVTAAKVAKEQELGDYRLVINDGKGAGQEVFHLHAHLLAGRDLTWPPG